MAAQWINDALKLTSEGKPFFVITVCAVEGSAPRETGAKMIVSHDKQWGTIGGGALEFTAAAHGRALLENQERHFAFEEFPLGPALGQCCGGRVLLSYERFGARDRVWLQQARDVLAENGAVVLERKLPGGAWRVIDHDGAEQGEPVILIGENGDIASDKFSASGDITHIRETISDARVPVYLFGAGHVGKAIAQHLALLPVDLHWIDRREDSFPEAAHSSAHLIHTDQETDIVANAPPSAGFFVLTHSHQLDYDLVMAILKRGDSAYCGLIGSKTKRARFEGRLRRAGVSDMQLQHLRCPIGENGMGSKLPSFIALNAVHEMLRAVESYKKANND